MAVSSFQITIYDYLRIFFHRATWICSFFTISLAAAFCWLEWVATPQYRSDMVVMVWARDLEMPVLRRMVQDIPLNRLIAAIRDKLQVDSRLQDMAANLRWRIKQRVWESRLAKHPAQQIDEKYFRNRLAALAAGQECVLQPSGIVVSRCWWLRESVRIGLQEFVANLDTPSLAWILGAARDVREGIIINSEDDQIYLGGLRRLLLPEAAQVTAAEVRQRAEVELLRRLQAECAKAGGGQFDEIARQEIVKEIVALTPLLELDLYDVVGMHFHRPAEMSPWITRLKSGLSVAAGRNNLVAFQCELALYRRRVPFDKDENVITDEILRIAYEIMKGEFQSIETARWENAASALAKQMEATQREIEEINKKLYDYDNLTSLQLAFVESPPLDARTLSESLPRNWSDPFLGLRQHSVHIRRMDEISREIDDIVNLELPELTARLRAIQQQIADPKNQRIRIETRRPVERGAPPEALALQRQRQAKALELNRLLRNNTEKHPLVQKVMREIEEIDMQLRAYAAHPVPEIVEKEEHINPQLAEWRKEEKELTEKIALKKQRQEQLRNLFEIERGKAKEAIEKQQTYQTLIERQRILQGQLAEIQRQSQELQNKRLTKEETSVELEIHTHPRKPERPFTPQAGIVYLVALFIGLLAVVSVVFTLEYTDHSIKSPQDVKRHLQLPVLGTIPDFAFAGQEQEEQLLERWRRRLWGARRVYPPTVDVEEPLPLPERRAAVARRRFAGFLWLAAVLAILLALGVYSYPHLGVHAAAIWQKMLKTIGRDESSTAPEIAAEEQTRKSNER